MATRRGAVGRRERRSAGAWRQLIGEWQLSGEGLASFCKRRRVSASTLCWWRWRLGLGGGRGVGSRSARREEKAPAPWIEVQASRQQRAEGATARGRGFELRWPDGLALSVPAEFEAEALERLLAVLEASAC